MAKQVTIKFNGFNTDEQRQAMSIFSQYTPDGSYVDSQAFVEGLTLDSTEIYGKSIYATNVEGWGELFGLIPMANTTARFAWFERAIKSYVAAEAAGDADEGVTFEITTSDEELYWLQMADNMKDFTVTVEEVEANGGEG